MLCRCANSMTLRTSSKLHRGRWVRQELSLSSQTFWPTLATGELHIVFSEHVCHYCLDLLRSKKAPWASVPSISKTQRCWVRCNVLSATVHLWVIFPELREAERVKDFWVGVERLVHGNGLRRDTDGRVGWNDKTGR